MRIAVCLSGQPRTWKRAYPTWIEYLSIHGDIDIFYHMWDYNTHPSFAGGLQAEPTLQETKLSTAELQEIYDTLKPKKHQIESKKEFSPSPVKNPIAWWTKPQFYGLKKTAFMKREYEIENNFEYDIVFRVRTDLVLTHKIEINVPLVPNTLYTCMNSHDREFDTYRIGDIFYFADSYTYDQMSNFYYGLDYIDASWPVRNTVHYPPELAFYYFMKTLNIANNSIFVDCKIARTAAYETLKGKLDNYETT